MLPNRPSERLYWLSLPRGHGAEELAPSPRPHQPWGSLRLFTFTNLIKEKWHLLFMSISLIASELQHSLSRVCLAILTFLSVNCQEHPFDAFIFKPSPSKHPFASLSKPSWRRFPFSLACSSPAKYEQDHTYCLLRKAGLYLSASPPLPHLPRAEKTSWLPEPSQGLRAGLAGPSPHWAPAL